MEADFLFLLKHSYISSSSSFNILYFAFIASIFFGLKGIFSYKKHKICKKISEFFSVTISVNSSKSISPPHLLNVSFTILSISSRLFICEPNILVINSFFSFLFFLSFLSFFSLLSLFSFFSLL